MTLKAEKCRADHGIMIRIVRGLPACILPGGDVVHHGIGCCECSLQKD